MIEARKKELSFVRTLSNGGVLVFYSELYKLFLYSLKWYITRNKVSSSVIEQIYNFYVQVKFLLQNKIAYQINVKGCVGYA